MKSRLWPYILVIALLGAAAYSNTLHSPFVFDDEPIILKSELIKDVSNIPGMLLGKKGPWASRPLMNATFALNYAASGRNTWSYHAANLALHLLNAALLFVLIIMTGKGAGFDEDKTRITAAFTSTLFVVHPAMTEGVTYITSRSVLLAAFFMFAGLMLFLKAATAERRRWPYAVGLFAVTLLGMASREDFMVFPVLLVMYDFFFVSKYEFKKVAGRYKIYVPVFLCLLYMGYLTAMNTYDLAAEFPGKGIAPLSYALTELKVHWSYLKILALPVGQSIDHDYPIAKGLADIPALLALVGYAGLWAGAAAYEKKRPAASFGVMWFLVALVPVSFALAAAGVVMGTRLGDVMAEHRLYIPSAGIFLALGAGAASIATRGAKHRNATIAVFAALCVLLAGATYKRNELWKSGRTLWEDAARKSPGSYRAHYNLGNFYRLSDRLPEAEREYQESLKLEPDFERTHHNLGVVYFRQGRLEEAEREFRRALEIKPGSELAHFALGMVYATEGRFAEAQLQLEATVRLWPGYAEGRFQLARVYVELGRTEDACRQLELALKLEPGKVEAQELLEELKR